MEPRCNNLILAKNSMSTISTGGAQVVALMLAEADKKNVPMLIDILWNCIQNSKDKTEIVNQLSSLTSITSINSGEYRKSSLERVF